jgi:outer membrane murein-binding lipoprotein Lpp
MTTVPPDVQRKVRQLDNDVQSIYELLATIQATQQRQGNRLDELATDVGSLKLDVGSLKSDVGSLKSDVGSLKSDVGSLKSDVVRLRTEHGAKLDAILDHLRGRAAAQPDAPDGQPA